MNGRVYDYNLGRFLSVDPFIQSPGNSQSMNPYSYIMNNPLAGTDPSGYAAEDEKTKTVTVVSERTGSRIKRRDKVTVTGKSDGKGGVTFTVAGKNGAAVGQVAGKVAGVVADTGLGVSISDIGSQSDIAKNNSAFGGNIDTDGACPQNRECAGGGETKGDNRDSYCDFYCRANRDDAKHDAMNDSYGYTKEEAHEINEQYKAGYKRETELKQQMRTSEIPVKNVLQVKVNDFMKIIITSKGINVKATHKEGGFVITTDAKGNSTIQYGDSPKAAFKDNRLTGISKKFFNRINVKIKDNGAGGISWAATVSLPSKVSATFKGEFDFDPVGNGKKAPIGGALLKHFRDAREL